MDTPLGLLRAEKRRNFILFLPLGKCFLWRKLAAELQGPHAIRLARWHGLRTLRDPIVWVLHAAYAWFPLGLLLKALHLMGAFTWSAFWLHALGAGAATPAVSNPTQSAARRAAIRIHALDSASHKATLSLTTRVSVICPNNPTLGKL
jgi:uncharacterized protein involved in response to NO